MCERLIGAVVLLGQLQTKRRKPLGVAPIKCRALKFVRAKLKSAALKTKKLKTRNCRSALNVKRLKTS